MAAVVEASATTRIELSVLVRAAAAIDQSGPGEPTWRDRLRDAIEELVRAGIIDAPKSRGHWDGRTQPALPRWVRRRPTTSQAAPARPARAWHHRLHWVPRLDAERRLSPAEFKLLDAVDRWLPQAEKALVVPLRERSWQLLGDDKALEALRPGRLFGPGRLTLDLLRCRVTWPPVQELRLGAGRWLIVENWSTYESLCAVARETGFDGRIIFGSGNQVGTRIAALAETAEAPSAPVAYFGDIDAGGIRAARLAVTTAANVGWPAVRPARQLYELALASPQRLTEKPASAEAVAWARSWFGDELGQRIGQCLESGSTIRQEAVGLELLMTHLPVLGV